MDDIEKLTILYCKSPRNKVMELINSIDYMNSSTINFILNKCSAEIIAYTLSKVNIIEIDKHSLYFICLNTNVTEKLLRDLIDRVVDLALDDDLRPIHLLCENPNVTLKMLQCFENDLNIADYESKKPIQILCANENITLDIIKYVIERTTFEPINEANWLGRQKHPIAILCNNPNVTLHMLYYLYDNMHMEIDGPSVYNLCKNRNITINMLDQLYEYMNIKFDERAIEIIYDRNKLTLDLVKYLYKWGKGKLPLCSICKNPNITVDILRFLHKNEQLNCNTITDLCSNQKITLDIIKFIIEEIKCPLNSDMFYHLCCGASVDVINYLAQRFKFSNRSILILCEKGNITLELFKKLSKDQDIWNGELLKVLNTKIPLDLFKYIIRKDNNPQPDSDTINNLYRKCKGNSDYTLEIDKLSKYGFVVRSAKLLGGDEAFLSTIRRLTGRSDQQFTVFQYFMSLEPLLSDW